MNVEFIHKATDDTHKFEERNQRFSGLKDRLTATLSNKHSQYEQPITLEMYQRAKSKLANKWQDTFAAEKKMLEELKLYAN